MESSEGFNPLKTLKKASSFSKVVKKGSKLQKIKKSSKFVSFAKKNPKKLLAGAAVGTGLGYTAIESGIKGTNFVDELQDNVGGVAGSAIGAMGGALGIPQETIDFIKNNWKNILFGILFLYLYMSFGFMGILILLVIYFVLKYDGIGKMREFYKKIEPRVQYVKEYVSTIYEKYNTA